MRIGKLTFDGQNSSDFGLIVAGAGTFDPALPDMTAYTVPGKNGDVFLDNKRYKNVDVTYPGFIADAFVSNSQGIRNWILGPKSYKRLEDNFDTTHFRMAIGSSVEFSPVAENTAANMSITFNCKPQRFLKSGDIQLWLNNGQGITNPTPFHSLPIFQANSPTVGATIEVICNDAYYKLEAKTAYAGIVTIDCERMAIYSGSDNLNDYFEGDFPEIHETATIRFSGITGVLIMLPRWWEL